MIKIYLKAMGIPVCHYAHSLLDGRRKKMDCKEVVEMNAPFTYGNLIIMIPQTDRTESTIIL